MIENPMDVLAQFPVRKSKIQKQAFRAAVQSYATGLGYECNVEKGNMGVHNVVIGAPETARYLVTAHYDTCAGLPFPNIVTPQNVLTYILYQLLVVAAYIVASIVPGILVGLLLQSPRAASLVGVAIYWILLIMMMVGPANKHNANDNTSGVVTVLEAAKHLPEAYRDRVCFVLFDLEEAGLIGSSAYRKKHKKATENQIVLNLDCVGDGDEILMIPVKKVRKDSGSMDALRSICGSWGAKSVKLHEKGFSVYPSDQSNFPYGVAVAAFHRSSWAGLYYSRIHTHSDIILEEENVNILRRVLIRFITGAAE